MSSIIRIILIACIIVLSQTANQQQQIITSISLEVDDAKVAQKLVELNELVYKFAKEMSVQKQATTQRLLTGQSNKPDSTIVIFLVVAAISFLFLFIYYMSRRCNRRFVKSNYSQKFQNVMEEVTFRGGRAEQQI